MVHPAQFSAAPFRSIPQITCWSVGVIYRFEHFEVDDTEFRLSAQNQNVQIEPKALRVLLCLLENRNRLVRKQELLDRVWKDAFVTESTLTRTISILRKLLADDKRELRLIETVPTLGYRFNGRVEIVSSGIMSTDERQSQFLSNDSLRISDEASLSSAPIPGPETSRPAILHPWRSVMTIVAIVLLVGGVAVVRQHRERGTERAKWAPPSRIQSLVVLPLVNHGGPEDAYLGDSIADEISTVLAQYSNLRVLSMTSARIYGDANQAPPQIAEKLHVNAMLEGSVVRAGGRIEINLRLVDAINDRQLWSQEYERDGNNLVGLQNQIGRELVQVLNLPLSAQDQERLQMAQTSNPTAYDNYLRAKFLLYKWIIPNHDSAEQFESATRLLKEAIRLDPHFAAAYASLAKMYQRHVYFDRKDAGPYQEKASALVQEALNADPYLSDAYVVRGQLNFERTNGFHWEAAARAFKQAIALNNNDADAHAMLGLLYFRSGLLDKAEVQLKIAHELDPAFDPIPQILARVYFCRGDYRQALEIFDDQKATWAAPYRAESLWYLGRHDEALDLLGAAFRQNPELRRNYETTSTEAFFLAAQGRRKEAEEAIRRSFGNRTDTNNSVFVYSEYRLATAYALLGNKTKAMPLLEEVAGNGFPCYPLYAHDPALDSLRGDPTFKALLEHLDHDWEMWSAEL